MEPQETQRKLTTIFSTDVQGYSRLMADDELATVHTLKAYREVISSHIEKHGGRVIDSPGDNLLAEFGSVVHAVESAVEIQRALKKRNEELPQGRKMRFRIGINLGDVIVDGERLYGDGVNIAARLEGLAEGGGICVSGDVQRQVEGKLLLGFEDLGEQEVKNISKPVHAYRVLMKPGVVGTAGTVRQAGQKRRRRAVAAAVAMVVLGGVAVWNFYLGSPPIEPTSVEKMKFPLSKKPSIAVLPFTNMSDDKAQEYFSDGITEDIITDLSKVSGLVVIARNSTFEYKGKPVDVREVARDLGVRHVLEGSVRRSGERLRITVQLIDAIKGSHVWAERYDRELKDVFSIQSEIAAKVASELSVTLKASEHERLIRRHTDNFEAYETYLRARRLGSVTRNPDRLAKRMRLAERVVELDPRFGGGYALQSLFYGQGVRQGQSASPDKDIKRALKLAEQAVAVDPTFARSHVALGDAYLMLHQHDKAVAAAREAIRIQPSAAGVHARLGHYLLWSGRGKEAIDALKMAMQLNPRPRERAAYRNETYLGMAYFTAGRYEDAIASFNLHYARRVRIGAHGLCFLAAAYIATGRDEKARAAMKSFLDKKPGTTLSNYQYPRLYKRKEDLDRYLNLLRKAGMPE